MSGYSVFIAHAPADARVAEDLTRLLAETGATVVYGADSSPTPEAQDDLERAALAADAYVVVLSRASIASPRLRAVTRKYHERRQHDRQRVLLPVALEAFPPHQLWPFLARYPRIEVAASSVKTSGEWGLVATQNLALGIMQALRLATPPRLRSLTSIPVQQPERLGRTSRPLSAPITRSLVPQLQTSPTRAWPPPRALAIGGVVTALVALLVATLAFFSGATPFHLAQSPGPAATATVRTLILATDTVAPSATVAPTVAPTKTASPKRTATPAPTHTPLPTPTVTPIPSGTGLAGRYYAGANLQEPSALSRLDSTINFDWGVTAPDPQFQGTNYSVRWTGRLRATVTGTYTITFIADDGVRLYFNGNTSLPAIDDWNAHGPQADSFNVDLIAGQFYKITIEYFECCGGDAVAQLYWSVGGSTRAIIPTEQLYAQ